MTITLTRLASPSDVTLGSLDVDGAWECWTLEPAEDRSEYPAIPDGRYQVVINKSTRFRRRLPLLLNVPGRLGVRIHPGNSVDPAPGKPYGDSEGCILLGTEKTEDTVLNSRVACEAFQAKLASALANGDEAWITIQDTEQNA